MLADYREVLGVLAWIDSDVLTPAQAVDPGLVRLYPLLPFG